MELMKKFEDTDLKIIDRNGKEWFTATDIGRALGYANPRTDIANLFKRNAQEIEAHETCVCKLQAQGDTQARDYRLFTKAGAKMLAVFARTPKAAAFRRWLVDLSEREEQKRAERAERKEMERRAHEILGDRTLLVHQEHSRRAALKVPEHVEFLELAENQTPLPIIAEIMNETVYDVQARGSCLAELGFDVPRLMAPTATGLQAQPGVTQAPHSMMIDEYVSRKMANTSDPDTQDE